MSAELNHEPPNGSTPTLREQCERILHELEQLYAQTPRKSLMKSIDEVKLLMARLPRDEPPHP